MLPKGPTLQGRVQRAVVTLIALVALLASVPGAHSSTAPQKCACCRAASAQNSCTPSCCSAPIKDEAPVAPAPVQSSQTLDWQALVHVMSADLLPQPAQVFSVKPASTLL